jgi:hypothetical protein
MSERNYWVFCDNNCKFPAMTKEQTLTAITQAVNEGTIGDIDTGFVTTIKTINGQPLKFFVGMQSAYEALTDAEKENLFAIITNDTFKESILSAVESLTAHMGDILNGEVRIPKASEASEAKSIVAPVKIDSVLRGNAFVYPISEAGLYSVNVYISRKSNYETLKNYCFLLPIFHNGSRLCQNSHTETFHHDGTEMRVCVRFSRNNYDSLGIYQIPEITAECNSNAVYCDISDCILIEKFNGITKGATDEVISDGNGSGSGGEIIM